MTSPWTRRSRACVPLLALVAMAACGRVEKAPCGEQMFQIHAVRVPEDCRNCDPLTVSSTLTKASRLAIERKPLLEIDRCEIDRILAFADAASLQLTPAASARLSASADLQAISPEQILALRVAGSPEIESLLRARNIGLNIPLFDVDSKEEIDSLVERTKVSEVMWATEISVADETTEVLSQAALESRKLTESAKRDQKQIDVLKRLLAEGEKDSDAFAKALENLEETE